MANAATDGASLEWNHTAANSTDIAHRSEPVSTIADLIPNSPPRRRWRIPVSLKIFLGLLTLLSAVGGWVVYCGYRQLTNIREFEKLGGHVETTPYGPTRLRSVIGEERMRMFDRVNRIEFHWTPVPVYLLRRIGKCNGLTSLELGSVDQSDSGFEHLRTLKNLRLLELKGRSVTDSGISRRTGLTERSTMTLKGTAISDTGLAHLRPLQNLECLDIDNTRITDAGMAHLSQLQKLNFLSLKGTRITDAGLAHLRPLQNLGCLYLDDTLITDAGLDHLKPCKNLRTLWVSNCDAVTANGVANLERAMPQLHVYRYDLRNR